ncbi:MAG TPA: hypothetical protein P5057_10055, partial [Acidobacteriota bacterium]|nr:hypothetical protein [Acidobacteriota bacterium]
WKVTLATGLATTVAACFPAIMMQLLDFVALYGLLLMPMGAVLLADYWLLPRLGLKRWYAELWRVVFSWPSLAAWLGSIAFVFLLPLEIYFKALPAWFLAVLVYVGGSYLQQRNAPLTEEPA